MSGSSTSSPGEAGVPSSDLLHTQFLVNAELVELTLTQSRRILRNSWKDPALTEKGRAEAHEGGKNLKAAGLTDFDVAFTSVLQRANTTLDIILEEIGQKGLPIHKDQALNERDYGELTGLNKDDGELLFCVAKPSCAVRRVSPTVG